MMNVGSDVRLRQSYKIFSPQTFEPMVTLHQGCCGVIASIESGFRGGKCRTDVFVDFEIMNKPTRFHSSDSLNDPISDWLEEVK